MRAASLLSTSLFTALIAIAGCSQHSGADEQKNPVPGHENGLSTSQSRFIPIKPDMAASTAFNYKVYEFAEDGSWISIVPMPPKGGDIEIDVQKPGNYDAKLTNEKCAYPVIVTQASGDRFTLNAENPTHAFTTEAGAHLKVAMDAAAKNNYFCNVAVTIAP